MQCVHINFIIIPSSTSKDDFFSSLFSTKNNDEIVDTINFDVRVEVLTTFSLDLLRTGRRKDGNNMSLSNVSARRMENL